jgi:phage-related protein
MTTFAPRPPDTTISNPHKPRVLNSEMGDGWIQRIEDGLNSDMPALTLTWTNLSVAEATYINDFFKTRKGVTKFEYQPPHINYSAQKNFVCQDWSADLSSPNTYNVVATLQEVPL